MQFASIVRGLMRSRISDPHGSGQFWADRDRGTRHHKGLDIVASPGEAVLSPIDGNVVREAVPYAHFTGVEIKGTGVYAGYAVKLFYVQAYACGPVSVGSQIGQAEDLTWKYPKITNHIHMEVRYNGILLPPFEAYQMCF